MSFLNKYIYLIKSGALTGSLNRLKYIEQELAKKRGRTLETVEGAENDLKQAEDELYKIPEHLKVSE